MDTDALPRYRKLIVQEDPDSPTGLSVTWDEDFDEDTARAMLHAAATDGPWGIGSDAWITGYHTLFLKRVVHEGER